MRKRKLKLLALALVCALLIGVLPVTAFSANGTDAERNVLLSPGLSVIAANCELVVSSVPGGEVIFQTADFERTVGYKLDEITVTSRPDADVGQLTVGTLAVPEGQTLSADNLSRLSFMPRDGASAVSANFNFRADGSPYEYTCVIYMIGEGENNTAPSLDCATAASLSAKVPAGGVCGGMLAASDIDGDALVFEITDYPDHGSVILTDRTSGEYIYRPEAGHTGKDSFSYTVRDEWGNYAESEAKVSLTVTRFDNGDLADMSGVDETAALIVCDAGLMGGVNIGGQLYFYPDRGVTRSEFLQTLMMAAGFEEKDLNSGAQTVFADDADISEAARPYIAAAYDLGYINGWIEDGVLVFAPDEVIGVAEAAVMTAAVLRLEVDDAISVGAGLGCANWARDEIAVLCAAGVPVGGYGRMNISASEMLDRADAARLLSAVMSIESAGGIVR